MAVPLTQALRVGAYVMKQHLKGNKRYPLVLMLEPLFRCNLACAGCGKIDYPSEILNQRISVEDAVLASDECGAPIVAIAGGEPLLHKELPEITRRLLDKGKFIYLCTNALLLEKKIDQYTPHKNFCWDIHLDGDKQMHDAAVSQEGVFERAVDAIKLAKSKGFRVSINCTLFDGADPERVAKFFDTVSDLGIDGVMTSPGYAYERAPDQEHFLNRQRTKELFRAIFRHGKESKKRGKDWKFNQSPLFLDFLAGNQTYACTPWGNPTRNVFGWQRPCYLLGEGYAKTYKELMDSTDWDKYGVGNYEKCADCMVHSGFEATAVVDSVKRPWKMAALALKGIKTEGAMAKEIPLDKARKAEFVFSKHVQAKMAEIHAKKAAPAVPAE
ncbi:adenosyl-hopene transferase HpnH [Acidocella sp.]|jgi:hopanoid biosynthesis associated radical SAM protein HpnH|uniref:adenosyl-hopene transferase HpnH n=1 Tax=Acidocella sp. TaxID=50710 RepID=UPI002F41CAF8